MFSTSKQDTGLVKSTSADQNTVKTAFSLAQSFSNNEKLHYHYYSITEITFFQNIFAHTHTSFLPGCPPNTSHAQSPCPSQATSAELDWRKGESRPHGCRRQCPDAHKHALFFLNFN